MAQEFQLEQVRNDADGLVTFTPFVFNASDAGYTYDFIIREVKPDPAETGMSYDPLEVRISVAIADSGLGDGVLILTPTYSSDTQFENTYTASGKLPSGAWAGKDLQGRTLAEGEFTFLLKDAQGTVLQTKTNAADGSITFDDILYTQDDIGQTYTYTITEVVPAQVEPGMAYDEMVMTFTVAVTDAGNGQLLRLLPPDARRPR